MLEHISKVEHSWCPECHLCSPGAAGGAPEDLVALDTSVVNIPRYFPHKLFYFLLFAQMWLVVYVVAFLHSIHDLPWDIVCDKCRRNVRNKKVLRLRTYPTIHIGNTTLGWRGIGPLLRGYRPSFEGVSVFCCGVFTRHSASGAPLLQLPIVSRRSSKFQKWKICQLRLGILDAIFAEQPVTSEDNKYLKYLE